jgi:dihydrolipoamide dehydrogenase
VPVEDEEVSKELEKNFKKNGITIMTSSEVTSVDASGAGVKAKVKTPEGETTLEAEILLSAVGVSANIEGIGLEELGIKTDKGKIMVDKFYQTNVAGIYAIGDCVPGQALAHVASKEGIICVENIGFNEKKYNHKPEPLDYNNVPGCTYCYPEIASVGFTEKQARDAGYEVKVGKFPLSASGKASAAGHPEGFIKVIFDAKYGEWLGTHMIGYNVTEIIIQTVTARKLETTYQEVLNSIHPHPTISESVKDAIEVAYDEAIHL